MNKIKCKEAYHCFSSKKDYKDKHNYSILVYEKRVLVSFYNEHISDTNKSKSFKLLDEILN